MELWNAFKLAMKKYATFDGVTGRADYWYFALAYVLGGLVLGLISFGHLGGLWHIAMLVPSLSAATRRLRDAGYPPLSLLWLLLPFVGWIIVIYRLAQPTSTTANY